MFDGFEGVMVFLYEGLRLVVKDEIGGVVGIDTASGGLWEGGVCWESVNGGWGQAPRNKANNPNFSDLQLCP